MKKLVLLFTGLLIGLTTVSAAEKLTAKNGDRLITKRYRYTQPIMFVERGVEFMIFPDGSFDFNTHYGNQAYNYRTSSRRSSVNTTYGAPGRRVHYATPRDKRVIITHDFDGKVRRIGNVFINYDRYNRVKRIGSVYMKYSKHRGKLKQVGGLRIKYNRWGEIIRLIGQVNHNNQGCNITDSDDFYNDWNDDFFEDDDFDNEDEYYYRSNKGKTKKRLKKTK